MQMAVHKMDLHCIGRGAVKRLDAKILLDPFEKQLDLPAAAIEVGNRDSGKNEVVGQKHKRFVVL